MLVYEKNVSLVSLLASTTGETGGSPASSASSSTVIQSLHQFGISIHADTEKDETISGITGVGVENTRVQNKVAT